MAKIMESDANKWLNCTQTSITPSDSITVTGSSNMPNEVADDANALDRAATRRDSVAEEPALTRTITSVPGSGDPNFEVDWKAVGEKSNPKSWSAKYRYAAVMGISYNTMVVVLTSTVYTPTISVVAEEMHSTQTITTLGLTTYLFGLAAGALITAPLTEVYGRKPVSLICMCMFAVFIVPCALSESLAMLLVFRFLAAFFGSVMVAASPGMVSDMVTEKNRSLCFSIWGLGPLSGPVIGPIVGGFATQYLSWRWANWLICIAAGSALLVSISMRESYAPIILQQRAAHLRKITGDRRWWSRYESKDGLVKTLRDSIKRPVVMAVKEPICIFWNLYVGVLYGILYLSFTAYPVVFGQIRGWSSSISSLSFLGIGLGTILVIVCEPVIRKLTDSDSKDPKRKVPPEAVVSAICVCSILVPIGELWFAWTCTPASIHWIVPILAGVPFGAGNTGAFIYASSYLTRSYGVFAASAMVGNCVIRTMLGGITPFVGTFMFSGIGPNWSATILGLIEVLLIPIPFYFLKHGRKIREKSVMIAQLTAENERLGAGGGQERQEGQMETAEV